MGKFLKSQPSKYLTFILSKLYCINLLGLCWHKSKELVLAQCLEGKLEREDIKANYL